MPVRTADAEWTGNLKEGNGHMRLGGGAFDGAYSFSSRFEEGTGTNPEELVAAAWAGCFSMALANNLDQAGFLPERVETTGRARFEKLESGWRITRIELEAKARVGGDIDEAGLRKFADQTKETCPISSSLSGPEVTVTVALV